MIGGAWRRLLPPPSMGMKEDTRLNVQSRLSAGIFTISLPSQSSMPAPSMVRVASPSISAESARERSSSFLTDLSRASRS